MCAHFTMLFVAAETQAHFFNKHDEPFTNSNQPQH